MKIEFEWGKTFKKNNKEDYFLSIDLIMKIEGKECYMQLDLGRYHSAIMEKFINHVPSLQQKVVSEDKKKFENVTIEYQDKFRKIFTRCKMDYNKTKDKKKNLSGYNIEKIPFAGFIGIDFFEGYNFTINFKKNFIEVSNNISLNESESNSFELIKEDAIIIPIVINNQQIETLFDTATGETEIQINNDLFKKITKTKLSKCNYKTLVRPDFSFRMYNKQTNLSLAINNVKLSNSLNIETPDNNTNKYFFKEKYSFKAIIGNKLLRDHSITFDFKKMLFQIDYINKG